MRCDAPGRRPAPTVRRPRRTVGAVPTTAGLLVATLVVVAAATGCSSDGDGSGGALGGDDYTAAMTDLCRRTDDRLDALPAPPEQISADDWATEVARALRAEQTAADALVVDAELRSDHGAYTTTTGDLAARYDDLAAALAASDDVTTLTTEITELSLGRDDTAAQLGLDACVRSAP